MRGVLPENASFFFFTLLLFGQWVDEGYANVEGREAVICE